MLFGTDLLDRFYKSAFKVLLVIAAILGVIVLFSCINTAFYTRRFKKEWSQYGVNAERMVPEKIKGAYRGIEEVVVHKEQDLYKEYDNKSKRYSYYFRNKFNIDVYMDEDTARRATYNEYFPTEYFYIQVRDVLWNIRKEYTPYYHENVERGFVFSLTKVGRDMTELTVRVMTRDGTCHQTTNETYKELKYVSNDWRKDRRKPEEKETTEKPQNPTSGSKKTGSSKKSYRYYRDSYDDGYDDVYYNGDYDGYRYNRDWDYMTGVDDAMEELDEDW